MASVLAWSFNRARRGGNRDALDMGPYITRLAENLGVFDKYDRQHLTLGPASRFFAIRDLQLAGILTWTVPITWEVRQGPQGQPPEGHPAHDVMQATYPTQRQRPRQRHEIPAPQYARREAPPDPLTLESLYDRMDRGFGMLHDRHDQSDAALRYMMTQMSINVPHFFQPGVAPGQFAMPGQFGSSGQGGSSQQVGYGSSQQGGYGYGQYGYDPTPEIPTYEQSEEEEESDEDED